MKAESIEPIKGSMTCESCEVDCQRYGQHRNGLRRFRCPQCRKTYTEAHTRTLGEMYIPQERALLAVQLLLEGKSIRITQRITKLDRNTIMKVLVLSGQKCKKLLDDKIRNVPVKDVQADEIWSFIGKKEKRRMPGDHPSLGDAYTFVAIDRASQLALNFALGKRDRATTGIFIDGLRQATSHQEFQITTTDSAAPYLSAISNTVFNRFSFERLINVYLAAPEGERRYSPADVVRRSEVEPQNLTMRMQIRRFTSLTNGFSKKWENHWAALALYFAYHNFCRIHSAIRVTPAMQAGISDHVWTLDELMAA